MLQTYIKTAWRNIVRGKMYSALNIFGLAIGMAVALLIGLWVIHQSSYDRFIPGYRQAYQLKFNLNNNGEIHTQNNVCLPLADALKKDIPEIALVAQGFGPSSNVLRVGDKRIRPIGMSGGPDFLKIFQLPLLEGHAENALKEPSSIVLSHSTAIVLFGATDPLNKTVWFDDDRLLKVTGVLKDLPANSSFQFDYLTDFLPLSSGGWIKAAVTDWNALYFNTYISLRPNVSHDQVEQKVKFLVKKYAPEVYKTFQQQVLLQPLKDWHLYTDYRNGVVAGGLIDYVRMFGIIGVLVLLIACINFMNLSTARSEKRAREVGVRKVIGSSRADLIRQFLTESILITCLSFGLSLLLVQLALPLFNTLTRSSIRIPFSNGLFWLSMLSYVLLTGLLAGSRPAFYLSSFQPIKVLKGAVQAGRSATLPRKILVVLQFTCSIALIIGTIIVYRQIEHARNRPTGYDPNRLLFTGAGINYKALKNEVLQTGMVSSMTRSLSPITDVYSRNAIDDWQGRLPNEPLTMVMNALGDADYFKTMGIRLKEGSNFTGNYGSDSLCAILNESAVRRMRFKNPINQMITWSPSDMPHRLRVIGVVEDALMSSPFSPAEPTIFVYKPELGWNLTYRLSPAVNTGAALARLKPLFEKYNPRISYDYHFVDDTYAAKFNFEMLIGKLAGIFAALAIFISCLGLFGLSAYVAEQRKKEVGIRKVLGASVSQIWLMLSRDYILLVGISCVIASPLAFYYSQEWLQKYSYRIHIGPGVFVFSAILAIIITVVTISFQSVRTARMNPIKSLRTE